MPEVVVEAELLEVESLEVEELVGTGVGAGTAPPGPSTAIVCVVEALCPYAPTVPITVSACVPISLVCGVHEKEPERLMLLLETVEAPENLSLTVNAVGE